MVYTCTICNGPVCKGLLLIELTKLSSLDKVDLSLKVCVGLAFVKEAFFSP